MNGLAHGCAWNGLMQLGPWVCLEWTDAAILAKINALKLIIISPVFDLTM